MAEELIKKAEKEKTRWFVSEEQKASNASDYLEQAGNLYKSQKQYGDAAQCFIRAAALKVKVGRGYDAAGLFKTAGIQLKLAGDPTAIQVLNQAVDIYSQLGKGQMAAKLSQELGEGSEQAREYEDALVHFQRAAELFKGEGADTHARQCLEKVATFSAMTDPPNFSEAGRIFEEVGVESLSSRLGRFNARKYFFKAVLCVMASGDTIGARAKHSSFKETDYQFGGSREGKFLDLLITALESFSGEKFSEAYRGTYARPVLRADTRCCPRCCLDCMPTTSPCIIGCFAVSFVQRSSDWPRRLRRDFPPGPLAHSSAAGSAEGLDRRRRRAEAKVGIACKARGRAESDVHENVFGRR